MSADKLVMMANQIGKFFAAQKHADQPAMVADHIRKFWDPRMRRQILTHVAEGGAGLDPLVLEALKQVPAPAN